MKKPPTRLEQRRSAAPPRADGCVLRIAWALIVWGALLVTLRWNARTDALFVVGLLFAAGGTAIRGASLPKSAAARPRRALSRRATTAGWTPLRAAGYACSWIVIGMALWIGTAVGSRVNETAGIVSGFAASACGFAGILVFRRPGARMWRRRRDAPAAPAGPEGPWTKDHSWKPEGEKRTFGHYLVSRRMYHGRMCLAFGLLALPIPASLDTEPFVVGVKFALALGGSWFLWHTGRVLSMGSVFLGFLRFPYHPGERAAFTFGVSGGGAEIRNATFVLRHFEERRDDADPGGGLPLCTQSVEEAEPPPNRVFAPGVDQRLFFDLPADAIVTAISAWRPSYWEMEIRGDTREGPYEERILVPIYERPAGAAE